MDVQATINIDGSIGLILTACFPGTTTPVPGAAISNVEWFQTNPIGTITPGATPNIARFKPSAVGITGIYATLTITPP